MDRSFSIFLKYYGNTILVTDEQGLMVQEKLEKVKMRLCFLDQKGINLSILHFIYSDWIRQGEQSLLIVAKVRKIEKNLMEKLETIEIFESFPFVVVFKIKIIRFFSKYWRNRMIFFKSGNMGLYMIYVFVINFLFQRTCYC